MDPEIKAMTAIGEALTAIDDQDARKRVLRWANEKFGYQPTLTTGRSAAPAVDQRVAEAGGEREIPGIAMLSENGDFKLTVRDVKARSGIDAAMRLVHVAIRAHQRLTGEKSMSSKNVLVPLLKSWRVYDGNARFALAKEKGIIRNGDMLELDFHAQKEADRYIEEVLSDEIQGAWNPTARGRKKRSAGAKEDPQN